jgi:MFS family permease
VTSPAGATRGAPGGVAGAASVAVFVTFLLSGFNFAGWAARLPAVRDALEFSPNQMGLLLLVGAGFSLVALPLSGWVVQLLGARRTVQISASLNSGGLILASAGVALGSVWVTAAGLAVYGVGTGVWDAAMNLEGAAAEQLLKRSLMPRYHAGFSFGTMAGAGVGAIAAWLHISVFAHLGIALTLSLAAVLWATRYFLPEGTHDAPTDEVTGKRTEGAFRAWGERRTLLIGLVVLAAALTEGAANDWVSLAVVDGFGLSNAIGALSFAVFVTAMTGMRLLGTALLDRWGRVPVLRLAGGLALVGLLVFGLVPWFWLALVGVVAWGMGAALGFPVGMSAAADDPRRAPGRVAVVSTIGYSAFLAGPPLLGMLAEHVGYRSALLAIAAPVVIGLFVAHAARALPGSAGDRNLGPTDPTDMPTGPVEVPR